ncbi:uncharacterized protein LOC109856777 isoform X2 [Pseudomyrmex gracilis]|nr:uncharacterized protein LOC109856777 isoform X2 [Pseudomyrmex gracilis]
MGRCIVRIRAPLRDPQVIEVKVRRLQVGFLKEARCEGAYFQFSDSADDSDDETGRYCGHVTGNSTKLFLRRGPDLTITLSSDAQFASANPVIFSAQFSVLPVRLAIERHRGYSASSSPTCPVECIVRNERRFCRLSSPDYPSVYPRGIRCRIALESSAGRFRIGGHPEDVFDLMNYTDQDSCQTENCEDSFELKGIEQLLYAGLGRVARSQNLIKANDESIILDDRLGNNHGSRIPVIEHTEKTSEQLTRRRHYYEKKSIQRHRGKQYHSEESLYGSGTSEPRLRIKPVGSKITRKDQRRVVPKRYPNGDTERPSEIFGNTMASTRKYLWDDRSSRNVTCGGGDYLVLLENVNGKILEITKFCGSGRVPRIYSRGRNVILEFFARKDGTVTHNGFQVTLQEERVSQEMRHANCAFVYRSSERNSKENIKSPRSWYPPNTVCTYKFFGRTTERVSIHLKILRNEFEHEKPEAKQNFSLNHCPGNEITVYNGVQTNGSFLIWSYCDASHWDINNIQVPLTSSGNELLIRYTSAKGSYDGQGFTYVISYRFVKKEQNFIGTRHKHRSISLKPVNLSSLNLNGTDNYNCDNKIDSFKNWFAILVVFGIVSFIGAVVTIATLTAKCLKIKSSEKKLLQTTKQ